MSKGKNRNFYKPLRHALGVEKAKALRPAWRVVLYAVPGKWCGDSSEGRIPWTEGSPPAPVSVICDERWNPIRFTTRSGRPLPNLNIEAVAVDV